MARWGHGTIALGVAIAIWGCGAKVESAAEAECAQEPDAPRVSATYRASAPAGGSELSAEDIPRTVELICQAFAAELEAARVEAVGEDRIRVDIPRTPEGAELLRSVSSSPQLFFYELEPNVVPLDPWVDEVTPANLEQQSTASLYDAVAVASKQRTSCDGGCTTPTASFYLFESVSRRLLAGPEASKVDLLRTASTRNLQPSDTDLFAVPPGTIVVQDQENPDSPAAPRYLVLEDRPALSGAEIANPAPSYDSVTEQPNVIFDFTPEGRRAFHLITRRIAQNGAASTFGQPYAFAIVLDGRILSRPVIDFRENPAGIDGRTGAQISGAFTEAEARELARSLLAASLPVQLEEVEREVKE